MAQATPSELDVLSLELRAGLAEVHAGFAEIKAALAGQSSRLAMLLGALADLHRDFNEHYGR